MQGVFQYYIDPIQVNMAPKEHLHSVLSSVRGQFSSISEAYYEDPVDGGVIVVVDGTRIEEPNS